MKNSSQTTSGENARMSRQEKLAAVAAVLGEGVAERLLKEAGVDLPPPEKRPSPGDPDKLAWQKNRLIRRLRATPDEAPPTAATKPPSTPPAAPEPQPKLEPVKRAFDLKEAAHDAASLSGEHPVVIAHILKSESQANRVAILRSLPGPTARSVMQRLRNDDRQPGDAQ